AGSRADRGGASTLARGSAERGQTTGLRRVRAILRFTCRISRARGARGGTEEPGQGPNPAGSSRRRRSAARVVPSPLAGSRLHTFLPARSLAVLCAAAKLLQREP